MKFMVLLFSLILLPHLALGADFNANPCRLVVQKGIGVGNNNYKQPDCVPLQKEDVVIIHNTRNYLSSGDATVVESNDLSDQAIREYDDDEEERPYDYGEEQD